MIVVKLPDRGEAPGCLFEEEGKFPEVSEEVPEVHSDCCEM